jgi:transcriptional regulator GlxA family with amidase domain
VNDVRVRRAVAMMEKNIAEPLEIREIAQQLNVTMRQLNKAFMDSLNVTSDFYRDMRIRHAEWLLTNSGRSGLKFRRDRWKS